jgi:hypothetical protein
MLDGERQGHAMSRETPEAVFEHARAAMKRGDLIEVFACLEPADLKRIASNAVSLSLGGGGGVPDEEARRICHEYGFPVDDLIGAWQQIMAKPGLEATTKARDTMKRGLAAVSNLGSFLGALEGYCRRVRGGGSISSRLFQQETLTDVNIDGARARGVRVYGPGSSDDVEFVLRKGQWFIKLIPGAARRSG